MFIIVLQRIFVTLLCITVFVIIGMDFKLINHEESIADLKRSPLTPAQPFSEFFHAIPTYKQEKLTIHTKSGNESSHETILDHADTVNKEKVLEVSSFIVTAHFLNVRNEANASSEIIDVVKNGDLLEVIEAKSNKWLKLKDVGYVHSKYARLLKTQEKKQPKKVTVLSATPYEDQLGHEAKLQSEKLDTPSIPTTAIKSISKLTEEHIEFIFEGTSLANHGLEKAILEIEELYGINAYFTIAVMKLESGHGTSKIAKEKNNLFGLNAIDGDAFNKAFSFETKGESVEKFGQIIFDYYIEIGLTSIAKVANKYCKANPKWPALVMKIMKSDYNKLV